MPICITCSTPVRHLYTTYSKADDRSLGKGVRLTQCPRCRRFADKYVEHDFVVLFIDLVLIKPQVYRHLLFNRLNSGEKGDEEARGNEGGLDKSIVRLGVLLILFDVYLTWARIEKASVAGRDAALNEAPILAQYLFFLTVNVLATVAQHAVVRGLVKVFGERIGRNGAGSYGYTTTSSSSPLPPATYDAMDTPTHLSPMVKGSPQPDAAFHDYRPVTPPSGSAITTALLVSSCTKLFPILLVIWPTSMSDSDSSSPDANRQSGPNFSFSARGFIGYAVLVNNLEALLILLDCGYVVATGLAVAGAFARWSVEGFLLGLVGLETESGPVGDLVGVLRKVGAWLSWS